MGSTYERIYAVVNRIPIGRVATYGQIARLAGIPGQARQVGYALSALSEGHVAWHRVINSKGEISARSEPHFEKIQRTLLEQEGIVFDANARVSLRHFMWQPEVSQSPRGRKRAGKRVFERAYHVLNRANGWRHLFGFNTVDRVLSVCLRRVSSHRLSFLF
jgi:methylated-DNA-protein-cysteine methyltransferase-like protein